MKNKYLLYLAIPVLGLGIVGTGIASAHGFGFGMGPGSISSDELLARQEQMFQSQADLLGISVDELKDKWANGKTLYEIAQEKGITQEQLQEKMQSLHKVKIKAETDALVSKGIITQEQADRRIEAMAKRSASAGDHPMMGGKRMGGRGFHGMGF